MEVRFKTRLLEDCYRSHAIAIREFGQEVARRYAERVSILYRSKTADDLRGFRVLHFHPLKGDRTGQYAVKLVGRMRLILTFQDKAMTIVRVEEVSKHYDD